MTTDRRLFIRSATLIGSAAVLGTASTITAEQVWAAGASRQEPPLAPPDKQPPDLKLPAAPGRKLGLAIVGLGKLALEEVMPAFAASQRTRPVALVSGHPDKARKVAAAYGIPQDSLYGYDNYDRLADNPAVDAIYIILPNSMHAEFTIRGLLAGKHVLCEKPMATSVAEAESMISTAEAAKRHLMIAYRLHYEPKHRRVMDLCSSGALGALKSFTASNCQDVQAPNIRLSDALGGGPVGDVGVYAINAARYVSREEPSAVTASLTQPTDDQRFREVPESVAFTLKYPSGLLAHCDCSFGSAESRLFRVTGTKGWAEMDNAFAYRGLQLRTKLDGTLTLASIPDVNHFAAEMDAFAATVLDNAPLKTPGAMGLADMRIIAAVHEAARTGRTVELAGGTAAH